MKLLNDNVVVAIDFDGSVNVYGPFKSARQARQEAARLEREELCDNATAHIVQRPLKH